MLEDKNVPTASSDYWFKIVDFRPQNCALIDTAENGTVVWFGDTSGVFNSIHFSSNAEVALRRNGFQRYFEDSKRATSSRCLSLRPDASPTLTAIYSSGQFWKRMHASSFVERGFQPVARTLCQDH